MGLKVSLIQMPAIYNIVSLFVKHMFMKSESMFNINNLDIQTNVCRL